MIVIKKSVIKEIVEEALDNHDYGVSHSTIVNVNPNADPQAIETDPFNKDVKPRNSEELKKSIVMMANDIDNIPDDKVNKAYNDIKDVLDMATSENEKVEESRKLTEAKASFGSKIAKLVKTGELGVDDISRGKDGMVILRRGFYYEHGKSAKDFANEIINDLKKLFGISCVLVNSGLVNKPFRGGAGVKQNSHWWIEIKEDVPQQEETQLTHVWPGTTMTKTEEAIRREIRKVLIETSNDPAVTAWNQYKNADDTLWGKSASHDEPAEKITKLSQLSVDKPTSIKKSSDVNVDGFYVAYEGSAEDANAPGEAWSLRDASNDEKVRDLVIENVVVPNEEVVQKTQEEKQKTLQAKKPEGAISSGEVKESTDDEDDEDDEEKRFKSNKEGNSFKEIAKELNFSVAGAKNAVDKALAKASYVANMDHDDLEILVLYNLKSYIELLASSGELSDEEIAELYENPDLTRELPGFREYLAKAIKREMTLDKVDVDEEE